MSLLNWIRKSADLLDPGRRQRVADAAQVMERAIVRNRSAFAPDDVLNQLSLFNEDRPLVLRATYQRFLERAWGDEEITPKERAALQWVAKALGLPPEQVRKIEWSVGFQAFKNALAAALADSVLADDEVARLRRIAGGLRMELRSLILQYCPEAIQAHLQSAFQTAALDGEITPQEWMAIVSLAGKLGIGEKELLDVVRPQAERLIEKSLADARSDGVISTAEDELIRSLLERFKVNVTLREYIKSQLDYYGRLREIASGNLPVLQGVPLSLRAGEMAHFHAGAVFARPRRRNGQTIYEECGGQMTITDTRMIFSAPELSASVNHQRVISLIPTSVGFELRSSKGGGQYALSNNPEIGLAIYRIAVGKVNQTIINRADDTRRISREVRQRVWQRDGGRCVECGANQYLEFDHIIPVARGGDNGQTNVQILCRGCNAKKSDYI